YIPTHATDGARSKVRTLAIDCVWPSVWLLWDISLLDGVNHLFFPGMAANAYGDVATLYAWSGANQYVGSRWNTFERDDSGYFPYPLMKAGEHYVGDPVKDTADSLRRWGDYTGVAVDPVEQGFWFFAMYGRDRGFTNGYEYSTYVGYSPRAVFVDHANA